MAGRCASCRGTGGGCCTWLFHIKQKYCIHQHAFLWSNIQHSTFPHLLRRWSALSLQNGKRFACFPFTGFRILIFLQKCHTQYPPLVEANVLASAQPCLLMLRHSLMSLGSYSPVKPLGFTPPWKRKLFGSEPPAHIPYF